MPKQSNCGGGSMVDKQVAHRFQEKVRFGPGCMTWAGAKTTRGYGQIWIDGRNQYAHRIALELYGAPATSDMVVDHLCCNPSCVNPDHLEVVTQQENTRRGIQGRVHANSKKTHCLRGHELFGENLILTPDGRRQCKTCKTIRNIRDGKRRRAKARGES